METTTIMIMGVTQEDQQYEEELVRKLIDEVSLASNGTVQLKDISVYGETGEIENVIRQQTQGIILVTDAKYCDVSKEYDAAACALYEAGIKPFILVTRTEQEGINYQDAAYVAVNVIDYIDPDVDSSTIWYKTLFYRDGNNTFFRDPDYYEEKDIYYFIECLKTYCL